MHSVSQSAPLRSNWKAAKRLENEPNDSGATSTQDQLVALAWVRGEIDVTKVAQAYGLPETSTNEIQRRLSEALKAYVRRREGNSADTVNQS